MKERIYPERIYLHNQPNITSWRQSLAILSWGSGTAIQPDLVSVFHPQDHRHLWRPLDTIAVLETMGRSDEHVAADL